MTRRRIRVGIDVGGTFTDAVAIDNDTLEIVSQVKGTIELFKKPAAAAAPVPAAQAAPASPKPAAGRD